MTSSSSEDALDVLIQKIQQSGRRLGNATPSFSGGGDRGVDSVLVLSDALRNLTHNLEPEATPTRDALVILSYSIVVIVSLFGNTLVCHVVLRNRAMRTTTNAFITNLAVSDLLMTSLNVPFNLARIMLRDWPFGRLMCGLVPFVQVTSVYVSTFTMTAIALHRYRVIVNPLTSRATLCPSTSIIAGVWVASACLSLPHAVFNDLVEVFTVRQLIRCQVRYPNPEVEVRRWIALLTFASQFAVPLSVTGITYGKVVRRVWSRKVPGASVTVEQVPFAQQAVSSLRAKRKTIKMLMLVVALFAFCWMPLNLYHVMQDFELPADRFQSNPIIFYVCHWLAMSSVCYNPFIYWWLNDSFRAAFKGWLTCTTPQTSQQASVEHSDAVRQFSNPVDHQPATWHPRTGQEMTRTTSLFLGQRKNRSESPPLKKISASWVAGFKSRFSFRENRCASSVKDFETGSIRLQSSDRISNGSACVSPSTDVSNRTNSSLPNRSRCGSPDRFERNGPGDWVAGTGSSASPPFVSPVEVTGMSCILKCFGWKDKTPKPTFL